MQKTQLWPFGILALLLWPYNYFFDFPLWEALGVALFVSVMGMGLMFFGLAMGLNVAKARLDQAVLYAERGEFGQARELVLWAVRADPRLKELNEVKALYEIIVMCQRPTNAGAEIRRLYEAIPPDREWHRRLFRSDEFKWFLIALLSLSAVVRLVNLLF